MRITKLFLNLLISYVVQSTCDLEAIQANSRLPVATSYTNSIYDGDDKIFIFGGYSTGKGFLNTISQFQIGPDQISSVASFPSGRDGGGISSDSTGNIFYYGGYNGSDYTRTVFRFIPSSGSLEEVAELDATFGHGSVVNHPDNPNIAILIGGDYYSTSQYVRCFNTSSMTNGGQSILPGGSDFLYNSAFVYGDRAFVFGRDPEVLIVNLTSLESQIVDPILPDFDFEPSVATDGTYGYVIGGFWNTPETPSDSLIRFDPLTFSYEFIHVKNHPGWDTGNMFYATSTVYVEKLNRIYIFGGTSTKYHAEIWYIDLTPSTRTTTFNSDGKPSSQMETVPNTHRNDPLS